MAYSAEKGSLDIILNKNILYSKECDKLTILVNKHGLFS